MLPDNNLVLQLEELNILKCSLFPDELFSFTLSEEETSKWNGLVEHYANTSDLDGLRWPQSIARFQVVLTGSPVWFEVEFPRNYPGGDTPPSISVKVGEVGRDEQERWQGIVKESIAEFVEHVTDYPTYNLICQILLPLVRQRSETFSDDSSSPPEADSLPDISPPPVHYHALFSSHHLKSPQKRRSLQQWSNDLSLTGFAKVGYPGVIYCEGTRENVEEFVDNVKAMQWLALRLRFVEPLDLEPTRRDGDKQRWTEFQKVGEVVQEMQRLGRGKFVVEMGIGHVGPEISA
ncbi:hypothetical protein JAAARDRAFT_146677 [Jaapia argillacea MUCL 33604]|uniref:Small nuclear ribonucleoprotein Prp3 C-terminal domain-containing protein n=1 Tax=Jaapia argillacea MUCL 33604 TaxID=933084 RepID=A0A067QH97_9AGAM|nr:hypothetical protein JAAARDRAFT_146677 [Jaapia argillacea MUCL 33604]